MTKDTEATVVRLDDARSGAFASLESFLAAVDSATVYAFQPIVHVDTGIAHGYEALLRGVDRLGLNPIGALFDLAYHRGWLGPLERLLQTKAIDAFAEIPSDTVRLFLNVDARRVAAAEAVAEEIAERLDARGIARDRFCLEIPETQDLATGDGALGVFRRLKEAGGHLALDDFGQGYSRLRLLHEHQPDYVKIDRYFISGVSAEPKKRLFLSRILDVMHVFGIRMVAEGVETEAEFRTCKDLGFDLAQGFLIQHPTTDRAALRTVYPVVERIVQSERRNRSGDVGLVREQIDRLPPLFADIDMVEVFEAFRRHGELTLFPVIDRDGVPLGVIRDVDLKTYVYSPFGRDLMANKTYGKQLRDLVRPCPVAAVETPIEKILELFAHHAETPGVLMVEQGRYAGFMGSIAILRAVHEKNLAAARDQNPLTRLPGNLSIGDWVAEALADTGTGRILAYFDFDNFKPFNDAYGFRQGDRAIQLFAELMQKSFGGGGTFLGHVGGDDFFAGFTGTSEADVQAEIVALLDRFRHEVESFYEPEARRCGYLEATGRDGLARRFGLLTCSAGLLVLPAGRPAVAVDRAMAEIARLKKTAKAGERRLAVAELAG